MRRWERVRPPHRRRFGTDYADALLLDQQASGDEARSLGWTPARRSLIEELGRR